MHEYIKSEMGKPTESSLITLAVKMYASKDIYADKDNSANGTKSLRRIDKTKLLTMMTRFQSVKCPSRPYNNVSVSFLLDKDQYGVDIVAFFVQR